MRPVVLRLKQQFFKQRFTYICQEMMARQKKNLVLNQDQYFYHVKHKFQKFPLPIFLTKILKGEARFERKGACFSVSYSNLCSK
jgi:hypothetical protein